jgi:hypothetical protein
MPSVTPTTSWEESPLQLISAEIIPEGLEPLGQLKKGAKLIVSSIAVNITISEVKYMPRFNPRKPNLKYYSTFEGPGLSGIVITEQWTAAYDSREAVRHGYVCFDVNPDKLKLTNFVCLRLGKGVSRMDAIADGAEKVDIGLVKVQGAEDYMRVGIFEVGPKDKDWIEKGKVRTVTLV